MSDPYISEVKYLGAAKVDFIEIAVDAGTDVSDLTVTIYNASGTVRSTNSLSGSSFNTMSGKDVYVIEQATSSTFSGLHKFGGVALSENGTVYQFISFQDNGATINARAGAANGLTSTDVGLAGSGQSLETRDGGATYSTQADPTKGSIPCLTRGTRIRTDQGMVKVEDLTPGMRLETIDGTFAPLRLVLKTCVSRKDLIKDAHLAPVRISAGALGVGLPTCDLLVSRQHRMLVSSGIAQRMFGEASVLVAAVRLTELPGIFVDTDVPGVEYFHLLLDQHHIIFAEGAPTESFFVGDQIKSTLSQEVRQEIHRLFPETAEPGHSDIPARPIPQREQQKRLIARHAKNARDVLVGFTPAQQTPVYAGLRLA